MTLDTPDAGLWPRWYQGTEEIRSSPLRIPRVQFCLWSRREISLRTNGRVYQAVVHSILILQLRDVVNTSRKWNGAGGFWQRPRLLTWQRLRSASVLIVYRGRLSEEGSAGMDEVIRDLLLSTLRRKCRKYVYMYLMIGDWQVAQKNQKSKIKGKYKYLVIFWKLADPAPMLLQVVNGSSTKQLCMQNCSFFYGFSRFVEQV